MSPLDQILFGMRWAAFGIMTFALAFMLIISVLRIILAIVRWRQAVLWARMSPEQRVAVRCRQYVEALRRERGE